MTTLIDTHCHLNFNTYDDDRDAVIERATDAGVQAIIIPAIDLDTCEEILKLCDQYALLYAAVGIHPNDTANYDTSWRDRVREYAQHPKVVAIGEIGLDYYWDKSPRTKQQSALEDQLNLADELDLPVIIHNRESHDDMLNTLEQWVRGHDDQRETSAGVMHSFSTPPTYASRAIQAGFYLGFTGPITFKKAEETRQIAKETPTDRLLIETDGPFLTPQPYRGKRNEPAYVQYVNGKIAELHGVSSADMGRITTDNAIRLFNLPING